MPEKRVYAFGPFRIDLPLNRLERQGAALPLPPKTFDLLVLLARNTDRVMDKAELMETLWPGIFVDQANLTQRVYMLRKTLGDQPDGRPYIETVPRRGYRLDAVVQELVVDPRDASDDREASKAASGIEGERKHATVLDCRIANPAALVERLGPADAEDRVRSLLSIAEQEVHRYEGAISHRHGEGFIAVFGVPVVHEDDARRAVLAALEIRERFQSSGPVEAAPREPLELRIGVSTGSVVVTRSRAAGAGEYATVGDAVHLAGLLQQLAEPGSVLIGDGTCRAVEPFIDATPAGIEGGGWSAYRVTGVRATGAGQGRVRTLAPFVGRQHELALLEGLVRRAREGDGQVVGIVGEPGIGKSRLLHELVQQVATPAGLASIEGRCVSYGSLIPYLPLADLIRGVCGIGDGDSPETVRLAIDRAFQEHDLPADHAPYLLRLIGVAETEGPLDAISPEALKARTFDALRALLSKAGGRRGLLIAIEDLHWIDRTSEEFLTGFVERMAGAPILLVTTYRPGYRIPWSDRSYLTQITLAPLPAADGARLVGSLAREQRLSEDLSAAIVEKGEGNPFFLEELTRTMVEGHGESHGIPDTVQGVIMARVDRLSGPAKHLLQIASVLGREVPLRLLEMVWPQSDSREEREVLCRLEFLHERAGTDEPVLVFKHALTQEVVYDSLLARSRRELHLRAAEALLAMHGDRRDELAATFAYHYAHTDLIDEAVQWLMRAADRAARVYANAEAILHLQLAARKLERLPEGSDRDRRMLEVALQHAHSLYFLGRFRESVDVLLPHEARLVRLDEAALTAAYAFWLSHMYSRLGDQRRARGNAARAIDAATRAGDEETLGKVHGLLALEGYWSGETADGIHHGETAVRLLRNHPKQRWWLGMAHFYLAMNHLIGNDFEAALAAADDADRVGKAIGDPRLQTYADYAAGWVEITRGNHDRAVALCRRSREQAPDRVSRAYASMVLAYALLGRGEHSEALPILESIVAEIESFSFPQWHGFAAALLAEAYRLEGRLDVADALVERALDVTCRAQYWYGVAFAERIRGRIARARGASAQSAAAFERAISTFERIGSGFEATKTRSELTGSLGP